MGKRQQNVPQQGQTILLCPMGAEWAEELAKLLQNHGYHIYWLEEISDVADTITDWEDMVYYDENLEAFPCLAGVVMGVEKGAPNVALAARAMQASPHMPWTLVTPDITQKRDIETKGGVMIDSLYHLEMQLQPFLLRMKDMPLRKTCADLAAIELRKQQEADAWSLE